MKSNLTAQQSLAQFRTAFGDEAPYKNTVYNWFADFKRGRFSLSGEFRDGRPSTAVNNKNIDAVRRMIETDRHVTYHEIRAFLDIGKSQIQSIRHKYFGMLGPERTGSRRARTRGLTHQPDARLVAKLRATSQEYSDGFTHGSRTPAVPSRYEDAPGTSAA
ncbi:Putative uncharacterized protein FLJ37770 [Eumeta japonica]|uniref:Mos1 transposase HTH domain-containing protein n=1 Tax=Eumeta variegata TaxID=151549 RepID=A0A4C1XBN1_EUMVA|nr:Putative uncharacterized protein FLJ37770 [Eumeta japonica]